MYIKNLEIVDHKGFNFSFEFVNGPNCFVGTNGSGKTTVLDTIAALTGSNAASALLRAEFKRISISVQTSETMNVELTLNEYDFDAIADFKSKLPVRTSYILRDIYEDVFVTHRRPLRDISAWMDQVLSRAGLSLSPVWIIDDFATQHVTYSSAKFQLMQAMARLAPDDVPMLVDGVEMNLHVAFRKSLDLIYRPEKKGQVFYTTHCPFVYGGIDDIPYAKVFSL